MFLFSVVRAGPDMESFEVGNVSQVRCGSEINQSRIPVGIIQPVKHLRPVERINP
jgi:hypothetical protein